MILKNIVDAVKSLITYLVGTTKRYQTLKLQHKELQTKYLDCVNKDIVIDENAEMWNNKWTKSGIVYKGRNSSLMDIRNYLINKSVILDNTVSKGDTYDSTVMKILEWCIKNIKYVGDLTTHKTVEYWQDAEETFHTKEGDCEDGAILMYALARINGIPQNRLKICGGNVNTGSKLVGHAYLIYRALDDKWYVLDWCFNSIDSINSFNKIPHNLKNKYISIWWTFNEEYSWAQHDINISGGNLDG